jgi:hypothetical protein
MRKEVWIGAVSVRPRAGNRLLGNAASASVAVLAQASNLSDYRNAVADALNHLGFELVDVDDAEPLTERQTKAFVEEYLYILAGEVERTGAVAFGTFHAFEAERVL